MTLRAWRLVKRKYLAGAFSGEGARRFGGRWNSPGKPVVYTAEHASLAVLEILVHIPSSALLPFYRLIPVDFEPQLAETLGPEDLPRTWRQSPPPLRLQHLGDAWLAEKRSAVLKVPSAVLPVEWNFLLNPLHPDFGALRIGEPLQYLLDQRLKGSGTGG
jgi:RES domain-containing protein